MYKVMMVDDDYPTIEFLSEAIDWNGLGLELMSTHENGLQAFEYAKQQMPDILITDIGMPKMDGIELTRNMKELKENVQVAIISCHNEFSYAQQALKLDVQDYILKESLDPDDLEKILLTCKERLNNATTKIVEVKKLQHQVMINNDMENQRLLRQFIQGSSNRLLDNFDLRYHYITVHFYINEYYRVKKSYISDDTLQFAIFNIMNEMIVEQAPENTHCIHFEQNKGFLFYPHHQTIKHDIFGALRDLLVKLQVAINHYLNIQISFLIGDKTDVSSLNNEVNGLLANDKQIFYESSNQIMTKEHVKRDPHKEEIMNHYQEIITTLKQAIFQRDIHLFNAHLEDWIDVCVEKKYDPSLVKEWFLRITLELKMRLRTIPYLQSNYQMEALQEEIFLIDSIYELQNWLQNYVQTCLDGTKQQLKNNYHKDVLHACYYVSNNIEKKLSLDEVAEHLYLNASYFSRLFKKELDITFVEYVKQRKVERAKELLEITNDSVGSVCEQLGYDNQSYFIKVFKKIVGCTPLEFRSNKMNGVSIHEFR